MSMAQEMQDLIVRLANLFSDVTDRYEMDGDEFADNAGEIWSLRERAKEIIDSLKKET